MMKKKSLEWLNCSEEQLKSEVHHWIQGSADSFRNTIVFLEGEMGAGKSTFARMILSELVSDFESRGSPTFPLVQEYRAKAGFPVYHIDLYRLKNENELENAGILEQIEEPGSLALVEWPDLFEGSFSFWYRASQTRPKRVIRVGIERLNSEHRHFKIQT